MVFRELDWYMQKHETRPPFTPHTRINSKWINDLNVRHEIIKIVEENLGNKITDIAHSSILMDISPQAMETKENLNKWDYIKVKRDIMSDNFLSMPVTK